MALIDFTLSNTRQFYSSMGNLLDGKGLTTWIAKMAVNGLTISGHSDTPLTQTIFLL